MTKQKRRRFTAEFKARVAIMAIQGHKTINEIAAEFGVHPNMVTNWKKQMLENAVTAFSDKAARTEKDFEAERDRLYRQIGQLQVENDWIKKKMGHLD
jgi:transposase-like protein